MLESVAVALPEAGTLPPPGDRTTEVAPDVLHVNSDVPAPLRLEGLAEKEWIAGGDAGAGAVTVTVTVLVTLPAALAAVSVYVVVTEGVATTLPDDGT